MFLLLCVGKPAVANRKDFAPTDVQDINELYQCPGR